MVMLLLMVLLVAAIAFALWMLSKRADTSDRSPIEIAPDTDLLPDASLFRLRDEVLSPAEREFFSVLRLAASSHFGVLAKVRVGDVLAVAGRGSASTTARNRIQQKHADFLLCEPETTRPLLVIELDDRTHGRSDRRERDALLDLAYATAGLPVLHVRAAASYSPATLAKQIEAALSADPTEQPKG